MAADTIPTMATRTNEAAEADTLSAVRQGWQICEGREINVRLYQIGTGIMDGRLLRS
jgi:hypothetical protein